MQNKELLENKQSSLLLWILAFQFSFQYICAMLGFSGASIILSFILICLVSYELMAGRIRIPAAFFRIILIITLVFLLSMLILRDSSATLNYFMRFLLYEVIALVLGYQVEDKKGVISRVIVIGFLMLPFLLISDVFDRDTPQRMGFAYSCLPILIASIFALTYEKKIAIISCINVFAIIIGFTSYAPRGLWLVVGTVFCLCFYWYFCKTSSKEISKIKGIVLMLVIIVSAVFMLNNFELILVTVNDFLIYNFNIEIYAFQKFFWYLSMDNVSNGREYLWNQALEIVSRNPFTGNGIGYYESINNGDYCHNILLEALCEAGLLFGVPVLLYIGAVLFRIINSPYTEKKVDFQWLVMTFCIGIQPLFLSSTYWMYTPFWFFLGAFIHNFKLKKV